MGGAGGVGSHVAPYQASLGLPLCKQRRTSGPLLGHGVRPAPQRLAPETTASRCHQSRSGDRAYP
eukprot:757719-Pyramimonas_sp.AAC.1